MPETEVLIVDDSMSARFALNRSLQSHGVNVTQAKTGEEGVSTASAQAFDIIFMDHVLPGIDGLQAMQQIRQNGAHTQTPIIMCTSNDSADYRADALERGANDVLCKPPDAQALSEILERHLHSTEIPDEAEHAIHEPAEAALMAVSTPDSSTPNIESTRMSQDDQLQAIDQRLDRLETMLERLETTVSQMDNRTKAVARAIADQAGRDLSNRLLRAVMTLKGK